MEWTLILILTRCIFATTVVLNGLFFVSTNTIAAVARVFTRLTARTDITETTSVDVGAVHLADDYGTIRKNTR